MKTKLMFFAAIAALTISGCSKERETPEPTPPPTPDEELYDVCAAGSLYNRTTDIPCYFKNGKWYDLVLPEDGENYYTNAIALHDGKVYVTIGESDAQITGYCIDGVWHAYKMPDGAKSMFPSRSIGFLDGSVYMAGYYVSEAGKSIACYWKDGVCHPLAIPDSSSSIYAESLAVFGGSVYIAGYTVSEKIIGYWRDEVWNPMSLLDESSYFYISDIACSEGSVYVIGNLGYRQACLWVDGVAQILSAPNASKCYGEKIAVADGKVYVAGSYYDNDNNQYACYWKDGVFHKLDAPGTSDTVDIAVADGVVFIAGNYYEFSRYEGVGCYWKDGVRVDFPTPEGKKSYISGIDVVKKQ